VPQAPQVSLPVVPVVPPLAFSPTPTPIYEDYDCSLILA
jgi:hypothetical protein